VTPGGAPRGVVGSGPRVILRRPRATDRAELTALNRDSVRFHGHRLIAPPRRPAEFDRYLLRSRAANYVGFVVCRREDGAIVGTVNLFDIARGPFQAAGIGYYVGARFAGQGYMTEAIGLALRHAFVRLGLHRVEAAIQPDNRASIRLVRRAGFRREGLSRGYIRMGGRWRDHERWALLRQDWRRSRRR
jgi:[ribosomal protein S5]-alanine N-acetyltransferase